MRFGCDDTVGVDLTNGPQHVGSTIFIDKVADQGKDDKSNHSSTRRDVFDQKMFLSPSFPDLFKTNQ